jgi:protein TonB
MSDVLAPARPASTGTRVLRGAVTLLVVLGVLAIGWALWKQLSSGPKTERPKVQQVAILRQTPPPPPKPPERPPDPPKLKQDVPLDQAPPTPQPEAPRSAEPPAAGPLGVDAAGTGSGDAFGLAGRPGGRDLIGSGGGGGGVYYSGLLQRHFFEALSRNRSILREEFRVVVRIWLGDDGRVQRAEILNGSGNAQIDSQIQATLMDMSPLRDVPPPSMRPMQLRLVNRS